MRWFKFGLLAVALIFTSPSTLLGQYCLGQPSFSNARAHLGAGINTGNDALGYSAQATVGTPTGVFGSIGLGGVSYDDLDGSSFGVSTSFGMDLMGSAGSLSVCPIATASFGFGPNDIFGSGIDHRSRSFAGGLAIGGLVASTEAMQIIPMVAAQFVHHTSTFEDGIDSISESDTYGVLTLGVGLNAQRVLTFTPYLALPLGLDGADPEFGFMLSVSLLR